VRADAAVLTGASRLRTVQRMRWNRWEGRVPTAAWVFFAIALVRSCFSWRNPETAGLVGTANLALVLAIGVVLGSRICWAIAVVLTGIIVTLLGVELGSVLFHEPLAQGPFEAVLFVPWAVQLSAVVVLHPRWNARWAEAAAR
jgi:ABC-type sugar transport system permease subunit